MSIESLTYCRDLAGRFGASREVARSLVRSLRLPRHRANDGTVRVNVDLSEIQYEPLRRRPQGRRADFDALKARIEQLQAARHAGNLAQCATFLDLGGRGISLAERLRSTWHVCRPSPSAWAVRLWQRGFEGGR
jgi:hypothetical protein